MRTFEELACYQKARVFRNSIARFCKTLPKEEQYKIKDQMIRSSRSITANIAEGYGRHHHQENLQYCRQSRGSLSEMPDHLNVAIDVEYMTNEEYDEHRKELEEVWKVLNGYIAYLKKCAESGVSKFVDMEASTN